MAVDVPVVREVVEHVFTRKDVWTHAVAATWAQ
jgi:hypothetical protein